MLRTWTTIAGLQILFLVFLAAVSRAAARDALQPETSRKVLHTGAGLLALVLPSAFRDLWPVLLLAALTAVALALIRMLPPMRMRFGAAAYRVSRPSYGEFYFSLAVVALFWLAEGQSSLLFTIPVLILTLADTTGALVGSRYGTIWYGSAHKTLEGSFAFAGVAFLCIQGTLVLWSSAGRAEALLIAATLALLVTLLEASVSRGRDNLFIPIGCYILLRCLLPLTAGALVLCFTAALVLILVVAACVVYLRTGIPWMKSSKSLPMRST